jgi:hypothetical protein
MSEPVTPITFNESPGRSSQQDSTQPSSPPGSPLQENKPKLEIRDEENANAAEKMDILEEDNLEGMDIKARALTNLLKTSSVGHVRPSYSPKQTDVVHCRCSSQSWQTK